MKINEVKIGKDKKNASNFGGGVRQTHEKSFAGSFMVADVQQTITAEQMPYKVEAKRERLSVEDIMPSEDAQLNIGSAQFQFSRIYLVNAPVVSSDATTKTDIEDIPYGLKEVLLMAPKRYKQKKNKNKGRDKNKKDQKQLGILAQDMIGVVPEVVEEAVVGHDVYAVRYEELIPVLIKAVQELSAEVDKLKREPK